MSQRLTQVCPETAMTILRILSRCEASPTRLLFHPNSVSQIGLLTLEGLRFSSVLSWLLILLTMVAVDSSSEAFAWNETTSRNLDAGPSGKETCCSCLNTSTVLESGRLEVTGPTTRVPGAYVRILMAAARR